MLYPNPYQYIILVMCIVSTLLGIVDMKSQSRPHVSLCIVREVVYRC